MSSFQCVPLARLSSFSDGPETMMGRFPDILGVVNKARRMGDLALYMDEGGMRKRESVRVP